MMLEADKNPVIPHLPGRTGIVLQFYNKDSPIDRAPENPIDRRCDALSHNTSILGKRGGHFRGLAYRDPDARIDISLEKQPIR